VHCLSTITLLEPWSSQHFPAQEYHSVDILILPYFINLFLFVERLCDILCLTKTTLPYAHNPALVPCLRFLIPPNSSKNSLLIPVTNLSYFLFNFLQSRLHYYKFIISMPSMTYTMPNPAMNFQFLSYFTYLQYLQSFPRETVSSLACWDSILCWLSYPLKLHLWLPISSSYHLHCQFVNIGVPTKNQFLGLFSYNHCPSEILSSV
jgi:hypothetical protein